MTLIVLLQKLQDLTKNLSFELDQQLLNYCPEEE